MAPSLTILATGAQLPAINAAPSPLRRATESKHSLPPLAAAPEASIAATFVAPTSILAAPLSLSPGSPAPDGSATTVQTPAQPIALPDHRALVDALVRARTERDSGVSVALETREFGAVALRFETHQSATGERGLQVALSSNDPGFDRAVASAAAAQAALGDQSGRNPAHRTEPAQTRSADLLGNHGGSDASPSNPSGGRSPQSDPQAQQRGAADRGWREPRPDSSGDPRYRAEDFPAASRPDRRRGSIFA